MVTVSSPKKDEEPKEITVDNITVKQLAALVWLHLGSPFGSVEDWISISQETDLIR